MIVIPSGIGLAAVLQVGQQCPGWLNCGLRQAMPLVTARVTVIMPQ